MRGLMMDYQLTVSSLLRRAESLYGHREIVSRLPDRTLHRCTYADVVRRTRQLALALRRLGLERGDRVATICWNHHQHLEAYLGLPAAGYVSHTLNLRLHPDELAYIVNHAGDRVLLVDKVLLPLYEKIRQGVNLEHVIVVSEEGGAPEGMLDYEALLAAEDPAGYEYPEIDENDAAAMCYTSGTTGRSKGVVYSHRSIVLHTLGAALPDALGPTERDVLLAVVPMFHANAWGLPYVCTMVGTKQVLPGPHLDPKSILELLQDERVTVTAGVPTIWAGILQYLEQHPGEYDLSRIRLMPCGGSALPESMIRTYQERYGLTLLHAWGMTETSPVGTCAHLPPELENAPADERYAYRARQGRPVPLVEIRARSADGLVRWDGQSMGELEVRGPWVAASYYDAPDGAAQFTDDGWFRTGDIVTISPRGCITIQDRAKDLVKSGGEWISSVALESRLMAHPDVAEAAVIAIADPKWQERPLAVVVAKPGRTVTREALREFLAPSFPSWWLPDDVVFVDALPRTTVGKLQKNALRDQFRSYVPRQGHGAEAGVAGGPSPVPGAPPAPAANV